MLFWLDETTPTLATDRTCLPMAWLDVFAVAMVMVAEVSFMPRSLPERMQSVFIHQTTTQKGEILFLLPWTLDPSQSRLNSSFSRQHITILWMIIRPWFDLRNTIHHSEWLHSAKTHHTFCILSSKGLRPNKCWFILIYSYSSQWLQLIWVKNSFLIWGVYRLYLRLDSLSERREREF